MTDTIQPTQTSTARGGGRRRRRLRVLLLVLLLGVVLAAGLAWVGLGTLEASRTVQERAGAAQAELSQFRGTLQAGDDVAAKGHLDAGEAALVQAQTAADRTEVRIAKYLPYVGRTVRDLDHLLLAARTLSGAGADALSVYTEFTGDDSRLFVDDTFSIPAIRSAGASVDSLTAALVTAQSELDEVTGTGPRGAEALAKRDSAAEQVQSLRDQVSGLAPLLKALPAAVGAEGRRVYLVAVLNPAESRASGGAPLSVAYLHIDQGKMNIPIQGQTSVLSNGNKPHVFTPVAGDPWLQGRLARPFVTVNRNPDFRVAGEQLLRASSSFAQKPDGVIALDVQAIGRLLSATGPIQSSEYGELTSENVAQKLVVDAYLEPADQAARHEQNDKLMQTMLQRLTDGGGLMTKARALGEAIPGRHLQMYFHDEVLQDVVAKASAAGAVPTDPVGDLSAVYTQNQNASKVDSYQHRTVNQTITVAADGSAKVRRTVLIENRTPEYLAGGPDPRKGYYTRWAQLLVMNLMPPGAQVTSQPSTANSPGFLAGSAQHKGTDGQGRTYADAVTRIEPGGTAELTWEYTLPKAAVTDGEGLRLLVRAETQPLLNAPALNLRVVVPQGWAAQVGPGWEKT
ncbi:MAG TPA: DUF4012 domain-containing protein, partial [Actinomycetales bacterium]